MENCIHCKGKPNADGYGRVSINNKVYFEHRIIYQNAHPNEDITNKIIHHICENTGCVNPEHLKSVSRKEHSKEHGLIGVAKMNSEKTHCSKGHLLNGRDKRQRFCPSCKRTTSNNFNKNNKEKLRAYKKIWRLKNKNKNI